MCSTIWCLKYIYIYTYTDHTVVKSIESHETHFCYSDSCLNVGILTLLPYDSAILFQIYEVLSWKKKKKERFMPKINIIMYHCLQVSFTFITNFNH